MYTCQWCGRKYNDYDSSAIHFGHYGFRKKYCSNRCFSEADPQKYYAALQQKQQLAKSKCFVATTVYNNYNHPVVRDLRQFRDNFLIHKKLGRLFIKLYYKHGPTLAWFVSKNKLRRSIAKIIIVKPMHFIATYIFKKRSND